ncbi:MAG: hypothetical protein H6620_10490 [Halobacteriovoraceae bacterium]|nr:hypothetical protein [Halobacteriovoraceae bacterium]
MLTIDLTKETTFGEPGPNLVFIGDKNDILKLHHLIKEVLQKGSIRLELSTYDYKLIGFNFLELKVSEEENGFFLHEEKKEINLILSKPLWNDVLLKTKSLSKSYGHHYIEFDDEELIEEVNVIVCSKKG